MSAGGNAWRERPWPPAYTVTVSVTVVPIVVDGGTARIDSLEIRPPSAMVGALMIARALGPTARSDEILRDVREAVRERRLV